MSFLQSCEKTLWVVTAQWEEKAQEKTDPVAKNDLAFLQIKKANHENFSPKFFCFIISGCLTIHNREFFHSASKMPRLPHRYNDSRDNCDSFGLSGPSAIDGLKLMRDSSCLIIINQF